MLQNRMSRKNTAGIYAGNSSAEADKVMKGTDVRISDIDEEWFESVKDRLDDLLSV